MRIGVIGAGGMGEAHAAIYGRMTGVSVAGIVGRHRGTVQQVAKRLHVPGFTDSRRLLDDDSVDAIDVAVPSGVHRGPVVAALEHGKHVFCETPVALTLEDADAMIRVARQRGRLFLVAQLTRFVPDYVHVRRAVSTGELGAPRVAIAARLAAPYWSRDRPRPFDVYGEPMIELSIFDFNYLLWLLGTPRSVFCQGVSGGRKAADHYLVTMRYDSAVGVVEGSARMPPSHPFNTRLRVLFDRGMYEADFRISKGHFTDTLRRYPWKGNPKALRAAGGDPYKAECAYFVDCVRGRADPNLIAASHDRNALRVALAARASFRRGTSVRL